MEIAKTKFNVGTIVFHFENSTIIEYQITKAEVIFNLEVDKRPVYTSCQIKYTLRYKDTFKVLYENNMYDFFLSIDECKAYAIEQIKQL